MLAIETCKVILERECGSQFKDDSLVEDVLDSLTVIEVVMQIEDQLKIEIHDEEISELKTIKDIYNLAEKKYVESRPKN